MKFKLVMVFVEDDKTDRVLDAARAAGATGATIISKARGLGLQPTLGIFGLELFNLRDVLMILVEERRAEPVLNAVLQSGQLDESLGTGIVLQIDVEKALGLSEHIRLLEQQQPPEVQFSNQRANEK